jgi:hypothetical protein
MTIIIGAITDKIPLKRADKLTEAALILENQLKSLGYEPFNLFNKRGEAAFKIYKFGVL